MRAWARLKSARSKLKISDDRCRSSIVCIWIAITLAEHEHSLDIIFRDNGRGMSDTQLRQLGFGFTTKTDDGHVQGFRIVRKLVADIGGVVAAPKSIQGFGTEIIVTLMKVGAPSAFLRSMGAHSVDEPEICVEVMA
jgi:nitrogen fixation/metabolism regulation signal transduction histidine kinase